MLRTRKRRALPHFSVGVRRRVGPAAHHSTTPCIPGRDGALWHLLQGRACRWRHWRALLERVRQAPGAFSLSLSSVARPQACLPPHRAPLIWGCVGVGVVGLPERPEVNWRASRRCRPRERRRCPHGQSRFTRPFFPSSNPVVSFSGPPIASPCVSQARGQSQSWTLPCR